MAKKNTNTEQKESKITSVLARQDDGAIQLTLTIPEEIILKIRELVIKRLIDELTIPGFRKGKAPNDLALKQIDMQRVYENTLQHLLPEAYAQAVTEHNLQPVLAPRFELLNVDEGQDWQVRAHTCEAPNVVLGDYKSKIKDLKKSDIWIPGNPSAGFHSDESSERAGQEKKERTQEDKEQQVIKTILDTSDAKIPTLLIDEEVNHRLSQLVEQVQKLGLSVEQYLNSTGKNVEQLKSEYAEQAKESIKLVLALNKVAQEEKVDISDQEIDAIMSAGSNALSKENLNNDQQAEQKRLVRSVLLRRKAIESLTSLI